MSQSRFSQSAEDLQRILQFEQDLAALAGDSKGIMGLACQQAQSLTHSSGAAIDMADGEEMVYRACTGTAQSALGNRYKMRLSLSGQALLSEQVLYCMDSQTDPRVDRDACRKISAVSLICVPLIIKNKSVGVIKVVYPVPHAFAEWDIDRLRDVAAIVSSALENILDLEIKKAS